MYIGPLAADRWFASNAVEQFGHCLGTLQTRVDRAGIERNVNEFLRRVRSVADPARLQRKIASTAGHRTRSQHPVSAQRPDCRHRSLLRADPVSPSASPREASTSPPIDLYGVDGDREVRSAHASAARPSCSRTRIVSAYAFCIRERSSLIVATRAASSQVLVRVIVPSEARKRVAEHGSGRAETATSTRNSIASSSKQLACSTRLVVESAQAQRPCVDVAGTNILRTDRRLSGTNSATRRALSRCFDVPKPESDRSFLSAIRTSSYRIVTDCGLLENVKEVVRLGQLQSTQRTSFAPTCALRCRDAIRRSRSGLLDRARDASSSREPDMSGSSGDHRRPPVSRSTDRRRASAPPAQMPRRSVCFPSGDPARPWRPQWSTSEALA